MLPYPHINPVLVRLGPLRIRWYGLMYVLGFVASYGLVRRQIEYSGDTHLASHFENLNFTLLLSLILGGRLGYVLFYNLPYY
ncbi:MAG: prolipoprotein diacylglyceryl transferase, partial [Desulfobacteraceae bacterium]|nr:prolipoprotein diacylglyceryl transferase [Desulfobacteraceae bacterium]